MMTMGMWNDENGEKCLTKNIHMAADAQLGEEVRRKVPVVHGKGRAVFFPDAAFPVGVQRASERNDLAGVVARDED